MAKGTNAGNEYGLDFSVKLDDVTKLLSRAEWGRHVGRLMEFLNSGEPAARLNYPAIQKAVDVANSVRTTIRRRGLRDRVIVFQRGDNVYLLRKEAASDVD